MLPYRWPFPFFLFGPCPGSHPIRYSGPFPTHFGPRKNKGSAFGLHPCYSSVPREGDPWPLVAVVEARQQRGPTLRGLRCRASPPSFCLPPTPGPRGRSKSALSAGLGRRTSARDWGPPHRGPSPGLAEASVPALRALVSLAPLGPSCLNDMVKIWPKVKKCYICKLHL